MSATASPGAAAEAELAEAAALASPESAAKTPASAASTEADATAATASLDRSLVRGMAWVGATRLLGQAASWASTLVVARLLTPTDYAIVGMAGWLMGLLQMLTEFGLGSAIVAKQRTDPDELRQLNTFAVLTGVAGSVVMVLAAPLVALFFRDPRVTPVVAVLGLVFTVSAFRIVPLALLQRDLRFARLAQFDGLQSLALAAFSVALAWRGFGYWTLVAANLLSAAVSTGLALARHPVGFARPRRERLRATLTFSGDVVAQRLCWYGYSNADFLVAGRTLGTAATGVYGFAWTLAHLVPDKVGAVVLQVTPGVLGRAQHDRALLRRYFVRIVSGLATVCLPLMCGLALVAPEFVPLALGARWTAAVAPLQILSLYSTVWVLSGLGGQILLVTGLERFGTRLVFVQLLVLPPLFWVGARLGGVAGLAAVWVVSNPFFAGAQLRRVLGALGLSWRELIGEALLAPVAAVAVMALLVTAVRAGTAALDLPLAVRFGAAVAAGALGYAGTLLLGFRAHVRGAVQALRQLRAGTLDAGGPGAAVPNVGPEAA